jgi:hydrogenase nickel incorporation protein HypA/HybF
MHELSLALSVIDIVLEEAQTRGIDHITGVELEVGALSGVDSDALGLALELAVKDTQLTTTKFYIVRVPAQGNCPACDLTFGMNEAWTPCPACGGAAARILQGDSLRVTSLMIPD